MMNTMTDSNPALSTVLIQLMKGVLYRDQHAKLWQDLLTQEASARDYLTVLNLSLELDDAEGYAFLQQTEHDPETQPETAALPRLIARRPLSYPVSVLLVLLRKWLLEGDATGLDTRTIITRADIVDRLRVFLPEGSNEVRQIDQIDTHINKVLELGFLRSLDEPGVFEIRRVLKAFVDAQWLTDFNEKLEGYRQHALARS
jgi:hypothetical protein